MLSSACGLQAKMSAMKQCYLRRNTMSKVSTDISLLVSELENHKFDKAMLVDALRLCLLAFEGRDLSEPRVSAAIRRSKRVLESIK